MITELLPNHARFESKTLEAIANCPGQLKVPHVKHNPAPRQGDGEAAFPEKNTENLTRFAPLRQKQKENLRDFSTIVHIHSWISCSWNLPVLVWNIFNTNVTLVMTLVKTGFIIYSPTNSKVLIDGYQM